MIMLFKKIVFRNKDGRKLDLKIQYILNELSFSLTLIWLHSASEAYVREEQTIKVAVASAVSLQGRCRVEEEKKKRGLRENGSSIFFESEFCAEKCIHRHKRRTIKAAQQQF